MQALGRLVETQTEDGLRLNGFWQTAPADDGTEGLPNPDVLAANKSRETRLEQGTVGWIIVHGVAGNFYNSSLLASVAETLLAHGHDTWRINTRGRDAIAYFATSGGHTRVGAAYEMIADSLIDLKAWIAALQKCGYRRIGLLGHSLGALKAALLASQAPPKGLEYLICISPPRLVSGILSHDPKYASSYADDLRMARELLTIGKPESLLSVRFPQPMLISAATFLDKYGQQDRHDYVQLARQIDTPCLWSFGEHEVRGQRASFRDCDHDLRAVVGGMSHHRVEVIGNADHAYTQARNALNASIRRWLAEHV